MRLVRNGRNAVAPETPSLAAAPDSGAFGTMCYIPPAPREARPRASFAVDHYIMKYSRSLASIRGWFFAGEAGFFKPPCIILTAPFPARRARVFPARQVFFIFK
ncbi:MAG: hypothetical protein LBM92_04770, partial [Opitutaceae bacterium]|nr:hypothetical protein [Opitutaceae bacterium]